jgi:hypothetical protein
VSAEPTPISDHTVAWVAAGLRRAASGLGVALPASYSETVARDSLQRCPQLAVSALGRGAVIHTAPETADQLPIVLGYADANGQWYRDGRCHHTAVRFETVALRNRMDLEL